MSHLINNDLDVELLEDKGGIFYRIQKKEQEVIGLSRIAVTLKGYPAFSWKKIGEKYDSHEDVWERIWGADSKPVKNQYNELTAIYQSETEKKIELQVIIRCFSDGVAIRYYIPEQEHIDYIHIEKDLVEFCMDGNYPVWFVDDGLYRGRAMNQGAVSVNTVSDAVSPITIKKAENCYICLHEADMWKYEEGIFSSGERRNSICCKSVSISATPVVSPWRVILICDNLNQLFQSATIENLNPANKIKDPFFVKPGKSMWDWRNHGATYGEYKYGLNTESMFRYIDFASKNRIQYLMIDGGWHADGRDMYKVNPLVSVKNMDMKAICSYGKKNGIGIWLYIDDEAFIYLDPEMILDTYKSWGGVGIKHGFLGSRGQRRCMDTIRMADLCAKRELMYDPHEPERPWGMHRTYPNMLTTEFINATYDGPDRPEATPTALTVIPFTNCLAAPVDRACAMFDINGELLRDHCRKKVLSTIVSQLAQSITFFTGLLVLLDNPHAYEKRMDLFEFIRQLPPMTWDESRVLDAEIGKYVCIGRRSNTSWFIGALTNEEERELTIPVNFLGPGNYLMTLYQDAADSHYLYNREAYEIRTVSVKNGDSISFRMAPGGGCAVWIRLIF